MPFRNWIWGIVMANLRRVSEILKEITDEFKKSNDEWEKRYGSADVLRSSTNGTGTDDAKTASTGRECGNCEQHKGEK
jgi:hypothetical protein